MVNIYRIERKNHESVLVLSDRLIDAANYGDFLTQSSREEIERVIWIGAAQDIRDNVAKTGSTSVFKPECE